MKYSPQKRGDIAQYKLGYWNDHQYIFLKASHYMQSLDLITNIFAPKGTDHADLRLDKDLPKKVALKKGFHLKG